MPGSKPFFLAARVGANAYHGIKTKKIVRRLDEHISFSGNVSELVPSLVNGAEIPCKPFDAKQNRAAMATMQLYQHDFEQVEQYLHHRAPYLLVEGIRSCSARDVVTEKQVTGDEYFLQGHFPGAQIFPGAMMQELTTQSAGILIAAYYNPMETYNTSDPHFNEYALGVLVKVHQARYKGFARPGDLMVVQVTLDEHIDNLFDFNARITVNGRSIMRNSFRLTNIKSNVLLGDLGR